MKYQIYYLKGNEENASRLYMGAELLKKRNLFPPKAEDYERVWEGNYNGSSESIADQIYTKFNIAKPANFRNRSMSVGDVVVLFGEKNGAFFCDSIGWIELPEFFEAVASGKMDTHICKYCGEITGGNDENLLCPDCREMFGHTFFYEL